MADEDGIEYSYGTPTVVAIFLVIGMILSTATAIYYATRSRPLNTQCEMNDANTKLQLEAQKESIAYNTECQKRTTQLQMKVIEECVHRGYIPVINNGNIGCTVLK